MYIDKITPVNKYKEKKRCLEICFLKQFLEWCSRLAAIWFFVRQVDAWNIVKRIKLNENENRLSSNFRANICEEKERVRIGFDHFVLDLYFILANES